MADFVFNHASLQPLATDLPGITEPLAAMLNSMAAVEATLPQAPTFRLCRESWNIPAAKFNGLESSLADAVGLLFRANYIEEGTYFNSLVQSSPSWNDLSETLLDSVIALDPIEIDAEAPETFQIAQEAGEEARVCAIAKFFLTSLPTTEKYNTPVVSFISHRQRYSFEHISTYDSAEVVCSKLRNQTISNLTSKRFIDEKHHIFPDLHFGRDIDELIERFPPVYLRLLFTRISELNNASKAWSLNQILPQDSIHIQSESEGTMNRYGNQRLRRGFDGESRIFEEHVRVTSGTRIHLYRHQELKKIEIGYIGPHLDTVTF
ncbi:hypothetical protein [Pseudomonas putida]|uniref:hypothetical protein n=1 Tax=Pseudomonas putida TaxID=303 RepID=UPI0039DF7837